MRYPEKKPRQCVTVDYANGTIFCRNTQQKIVDGTCKACLKHYGVKPSE